MLPTCDYNDSEEEEDYPEQNVLATYAKAKFARIQPIIQRQTVQVTIEPNQVQGRTNYDPFTSAINQYGDRLIAR